MTKLTTTAVALACAAAGAMPQVSLALLPPANVECCQRKEFQSDRCVRFELSETKCERVYADWAETYRRIQSAMTPPKAAAPDAAASASNANAAPAEKLYQGKFFEIRHPADFVVRPLDAARAQESSAATFTSPDGSMTFYVYSPQWGGDAPGIALDKATETEVARKTDAGKSSGVAGTFTWITIAAKDKSYTRTYQDFLAGDKSIHWVIGMKYRSDADLARYRAHYGRFKASLKQLAD